MTDSNSQSSKSGQVLLFGCFDPIHAGHQYLFTQAKNLGSVLTVVVAQDDYIRNVKKREPNLAQDLRLRLIQTNPLVDRAILGTATSDTPGDYSLLSDLYFDILALGYDQTPDDATVRRELDKRGKKHVKIIRLAAYKPEVYKSSAMTN